MKRKCVGERMKKKNFIPRVLSFFFIRGVDLRELPSSTDISGEEIKQTTFRQSTFDLLMHASTDVYRMFASTLA